MGVWRPTSFSIKFASLDVRIRESAKIVARRSAMLTAVEEAAVRHGARVDVTVTHFPDLYKWDEITRLVASAIIAALRLGIEPLLHDARGGMGTFTASTARYASP